MQRRGNDRALGYPSRTHAKKHERKIGNEQETRDVAGEFIITQVTADRLAKLAKFVDQNVIKIHIEKTFPLDQAAEALSYLEERHSRGKVILKIRG